MKISIFNRQKDLSISRSSVKKLVELVLEDRETEVVIHFVGKKKISQLHDQFFDDPSPTDCITFPMGGDILGEIFVCPQVAKEYDPRHPYRETSLYVIHGLLHLLGYDDIQRSDRIKMQRAQNRLLKKAKAKRCLLQRSS
ncbi:MAG: rRNA maturation RNase YbeY [Verrucomicrobia bacterium]|nr:rRNA maturation RNase YbeY [Verrucomicrobiota bacterium]